MEKRNYFSVIFAVVLAFTAVACKPMADGVTTVSNKIKIGVCIYNYEDAYMTSVRKAIEAAAKTANADLLMNDSKGDQALQFEQIDALIEKDVDVLAINIVDISEETIAASTRTIVEKAEAANLPLVFFNRQPDLDVMKTYSQARLVGTNPVESALIEGDLIVNIWNNLDCDKNGDGIMQYVMLVGEPENPDAIARTKYSIERVTEAGIKTECLAEKPANWDDKQAKELMTGWSSSIGLDKIEFIVSNNDNMATGAIAALQEEGYNLGKGGDYIPIVGVDAIPKAFTLIEAGCMSGTVQQDAVGMGKATFDFAMNAAQGKDFLSGSAYKYDSSGVAIRIPYEPFIGEFKKSSVEAK